MSSRNAVAVMHHIDVVAVDLEVPEPPREFVAVFDEKSLQIDWTQYVRLLKSALRP